MSQPSVSTHFSCFRWKLLPCFDTVSGEMVYLLAGITLLKMDHTAYNKSSHIDSDEEPSIDLDIARAPFSFVRGSNRNRHQDI